MHDVFGGRAWLFGQGAGFRERTFPEWAAGRRRWLFGPGFRSHWGPPGPRARRGDVRAAVLALLAGAPMHGYQVIQELERRSGGAWRVSPGSVYPTRQMLQDEGLVTGREVEGRREFSLTEAGRAQVEAWRQRGQAPPWEDVAGEGEGAPHDLRGSAFQLGAAAMQVAHAGSKEQVERAVAVLDEARRRLYAILAEEPGT